MGQRLLNMYEFVEDRLGWEGKVALAKATCIGSTIAAGTPETPQLISTFREAIKKLTGEYPPDV
jgi:hypothetical protein